MLRDLRVGTIIYVLNKREPKLEIGEVVDVKLSTAPPTFNAGILQPQRPMADITATFGTEQRNYKQVPADVAIADFAKEGIVISDSKDQMFNEVEALKKLSKRVIDEVDNHKRIYRECDKILADLDPEIKKKAQQSQEIENLKVQVGGISSQMSEILGLLKGLRNNQRIMGE